MSIFAFEQLLFEFSRIMLYAVDFIPIFILIFHVFVPVDADCPVYITISTNESTLEDSLLEVNWGPICAYKAERVIIYKDDATLSPSSSVMSFNNLTGSYTGKFITKKKMGKYAFPGGWQKDNNQTGVEKFPRGTCLKYFVATYNSTELLTVDCIKIFPNWMSEAKDVSILPLRSLFIPGSHASGAYGSIAKDKPQYQIMHDYAYAQNIDVWSQLVFGIRYLDFSVGFDEKIGGPEFWIVNEGKFVTKLSTVLKDIRRFLEMSADVVIMGFSSFPIGFYKNPKKHIELLVYLTNSVGDIMVTKDYSNLKKTPIYDMSVRKIMESGRRLLLLYPIEEIPYPYSESKFTFPIWESDSLEGKSTGEAFDVMKLLFSSKYRTTSDKEAWIFHAAQDLSSAFNNYGEMMPTRNRAAEINPKVENWLTYVWSENANVVTMDFFTNTKIVEIAVRTNVKKAFAFLNKDYIKLDMYKSMEP